MPEKTLFLEQVLKNGQTPETNP